MRRAPPLLTRSWELEFYAGIQITVRIQGTKPRYDLNCIWSEMPHLPLMLSSFHARAKNIFLLPAAVHPAPRKAGMVESWLITISKCPVLIDRTLVAVASLLCVCASRGSHVPQDISREHPWRGLFNLHCTLLAGEVGQLKSTFPRPCCGES